MGVLLSGNVHLEWPSSIHPALRRIGSACTSLDPALRPTAQVVSKVRGRGSVWRAGERVFVTIQRSLLLLPSAAALPALLP